MGSELLVEFQKSSSPSVRNNWNYLISFPPVFRNVFC